MGYVMISVTQSTTLLLTVGLVVAACCCVEAEWPVTIGMENYSFSYPIMTSGADGGAYVAASAGLSRVVVMRVSASGDTLWTPNDSLWIFGSNYLYPRAISALDSGGCVVLVEQQIIANMFPRSRFRLIRITDQGQLLPEIMICDTLPRSRFDPHMSVSGARVLVAWTDARAAEAQTWYQVVDLSSWTALCEQNGRYLTQGGCQTTVGSDTFYIATYDSVFRVFADGSALSCWPGIPLGVSPVWCDGRLYGFGLSSTDATILGWVDEEGALHTDTISRGHSLPIWLGMAREDDHLTISYSRIGDILGCLYHPDQGVSDEFAICDDSADQVDHLVATGDSGVGFIWLDTRNGQYEVFGEQICDGMCRWPDGTRLGYLDYISPAAHDHYSLCDWGKYGLACWIQQWQLVIQPVDSLAQDVVVRRDPRVPVLVSLYSPYPNPFNAQTVLRYDLAQAGRVKLTVFDLLGREVAVLADGVVAAGSHSAVWGAAHLPSGLYFAALEAGSARSVQKVVLLR